MQNPTLGQQILEELGKREQILTLSDVEKAELQCIESRSMLRYFYDRHGYDCVSSTGSVTELVDHFIQRSRDTANSRGGTKWRNRIYLMFGASALFAVAQAAVNFALRDWDDAVSRTTGSLAFFVLLLPVAVGAYFVDRKRNRRRAVFREQIATEATNTNP